MDHSGGVRLKAIWIIGANEFVQLGFAAKQRDLAFDPLRWAAIKGVALFSGKPIASMMQRVLPEGQNVYGVARGNDLCPLNFKKSLN